MTKSGTTLVRWSSTLSGRPPLPGRTFVCGRAQRLGELPWRHIQAFVDEFVTVTEDEFARSMLRLAVDARIVAEPSGAVAPAAAFAAEARQTDADNGPDGLGRRILRVAIVSGGNVDPAMLANVFASAELSSHGMEGA